jgi:hypothetical protein
MKAGAKTSAFFIGISKYYHYVCNAKFLYALRVRRAPG